MSASAFLAGAAVGGLRYGYVKYQLHERENVVQYSVDAIKQSFRGEPKVRAHTHSCILAIIIVSLRVLPLQACFMYHEKQLTHLASTVLPSHCCRQASPQRADERYVAIPSREHEYYTFIRESWNSKVLCFRNTVLDVFHVKK